VFFPLESIFTSRRNDPPGSLHTAILFCVFSYFSFFLLPCFLLSRDVTFFFLCLAPVQPHPPFFAPLVESFSLFSVPPFCHISTLIFYDPREHVRSPLRIRLFSPSRPVVFFPRPSNPLHASLGRPRITPLSCDFQFVKVSLFFCLGDCDLRSQGAPMEGIPGKGTVFCGVTMLWNMLKLRLFFFHTFCPFPWVVSYCLHTRSLYVFF